MPTFTEQISVLADDGWWNPGSSIFDNSSNSVQLQSTAASVGFFHFPNVTIPSGQVVSAATLTVRPLANQSGLTFQIYGEQAANPAAVSGATDGNSRTPTTHRVTWNATFVNGVDIVSADISVVVQEILNLAGWASGNALQLFLDQTTAFSGIAVVAEDATHPAGRAILNVTYSGATPQNNAPFWLFDD